jgi:hypothetical protein
VSLFLGRFESARADMLNPLPRDAELVGDRLERRPTKDALREDEPLALGEHLTRPAPPAYRFGMPERKSKPKPKTPKRPTDVNQLAALIVAQATGEAPAESTKPQEPMPEKNPAAVALGRLGGLKGGKARAESLSASRRKTIAKKAAAARWAKRPKS